MLIIYVCTCKSLYETVTLVHPYEQDKLQYLLTTMGEWEIELTDKTYTGCSCSYYVISVLFHSECKF
jgi:hypothetical protein